MALNDGSLIGLSNRFKAIAVPGDYDLGTWHKVDGLDVSWEVAEHRVGDFGNHKWFFPANNKYSAVKLQRGANATDSPKVRKWLNDTSFKHKLGILVTITLMDSAGKKILEWELRNAMPSKWGITSFDAGASSVAIETLELVHEGFLDDQTMLTG
ncbi:MAG TPA: phage tail protein [Mycobacteriales bacterium]|nr:phage tail protein [Mycobacteriales bacterium]